MKILPADKSDLKDILDLQYLAYRSEAERYNDFTIPPITQTLPELLEESKDSLILKAVKGEKILGSVRARINESICKIGRLIVHPDFQRQGLGTRLLQEIEDSLPQAEEFELFTGSNSSDNLKLYEKSGYTEYLRSELNESITFIHLRKTRRRNIISC